MESAFATKAADVPVGFVAVKLSDLERGDRAVLLHPSGRQERVQVIDSWGTAHAGASGNILWGFDRRVHIGGLGPHDRLIIPKDGGVPHWEREVLAVSKKERHVIDTMQETGAVLQAVGGLWRYVWDGAMRCIVPRGLVETMRTRGLLVEVASQVLVVNKKKIIDD